MVKDIYENICRGEEVRANLIQLKQQLQDPREKSAFAYMLAGDFRKLAVLLKDEDAKVRKNAALILGELESEDVLPWIYEAYEKEKQLFVRESYLKAMEKLDFSSLLPKLKKRQNMLQEELLTVTEEGRKHLAKESAVLSRMLLRYEKPRHHTFIGMENADVILLCNRCQRGITAEQISTGEVSLLAGGVRVQDGSLEEILKIRTWSELLFPLHGMIIREQTPQAAAETVFHTQLMEILENCHEEKGSFRFRVEYKGTMDERKKGDFIKQTALLLEEKSDRRLLNSISDYELEIRLVESKKGGFLPFLRLCTIKDRRFAYRRESIANAISPVNAALIMQIAGAYLQENAQVLDPFCGVGTMLIERKYFRAADPLYGVDLYAEGIQKARANTERAGMPIHYVTRDFFTFEHEYLFDELITDMPPAADENFYLAFFKKAESLLKRGAVLVLYNRQGTLLEQMSRRCEKLEILKTAVLNERQNSKVVVARLK